MEGHAVVLWQPGKDPGIVAGLAGTRTYPLNSSFRPSYNMAVNLVGQVGREQAAALLESSFAQFQADRAVVGTARQARRSRQSMDEAKVSCQLGDFAEYAAIRRELSQREGDQARERSASRRAEAIRSLQQLHRGDIIRVPGGRRAGIAVVLDPSASGKDSPQPLVLTEGRQVKRLSVADFPVPVAAIERIRIPASFSARSANHRRDLAATMRNRLEHADLGPRPGRAATARASQAARASQPEGAAPAARIARSRRSADGSASTPATAARTATSTPGRRSSISGCSGRPRRWNAGSRAAPTSSRGPSTGSAEFSPSLVTWTATP